jgi:HD superfamily phosphohydrolase
MQTEQEIRENLIDAGIEDKEAESIVSMILKGDLKGAEKRIGINRKKLLDRMHSCQMCIDRLDYLSYRIKA